MSARKLGRIAGLVFALAVTFGGVGAAWGADDKTGGNPKPATEVVTGQDKDAFQLFDAEWF